MADQLSSTTEKKLKKGEDIVKFSRDFQDVIKRPKMAFSIAQVIIEIKDAVGDDNGELVKRLEETANRLLAVERAVFDRVPESEAIGKAVEEAMENLELILGKEMKDLKDLADKSLALLDHEAYRSEIQQIFQRVKEAITSFFETAVSIQLGKSEIRDDIKKAALERLRPSEKADHKTVLEEQGLKREVCTDGTRVKILDDITQWANDRSPASPRIFWLTGQAGSGKTTIAYTIAKRFEEAGYANHHTILGGNFFCSRQFQETQDETRIIPTIAYQLARNCKSYANALYAADKFNAVNYNVFRQMKDLLVRPWGHLARLWQLSEATYRPVLPLYLIIIDALDEIEGDGGSAFLRDVLLPINEYKLRGLKFLVTSRSDPKVAALCESFAFKAVCRLQDVPIEEAKSDVESYLKTQLPKLASSPELAELGQRAGGLFIYAATAVKYLTPFDAITVGEQTMMLNDFLSRSYEPASSSDATSLVDELYGQIMYDAFSKLSGNVLVRRLRTLYTFLCTAERTSTSVVAALVLDGNDDDARAVLHNLHAVLYTQDDRVFWYHSSFPDFIFTEARSNFRIDKRDFTFWCNEPAHHSLLGESCFHIMRLEKSGLQFNMGNIASSFLFDCDNTVALSEQVDQNISAVLRYSSSYWTHHLPLPWSVNTDKLCCCISEFLQIHVLFWIEAMNLLGLSNLCTPMLQFANQWVLKCGPGESYLELAHNIGEAANFSTYFTSSPAAKSTPHLYISALATWPKDTSLSQNWKNQFTHIPVFMHDQSFNLPLMTVSAGCVMNVTFSSDGMQIMSGLDDGSVRVWDASTGVELKKLKGHTRAVSSAVFSSDGMKIVSGSYDKSVLVWDASTGVELKKLKGHTGYVFSVAFSSDDMRIVSGSYDNSVRVWDALMGEVLIELKGHTRAINSVAFSSDGMQIVSGSDDSSVRVWDASTGVELKKLNFGHTSRVSSVAFSSDGTQIVSGSDDSSVQVWDALTGVELKKLNFGHTSRVSSVAFSSDGTQIVSGSDDSSVWVWDVSTSTGLKELKGHTECVNSVAFSPDGMHIVSGSNDNSVRMWDVSKIGCEDFVWNLADNNWIISSHGQDHLMWVPQGANLVQGFNTLIISRSGFATVDFSQSMIGVNWIHCYTPIFSHLSDKLTTHSEIPFNDLNSPIQVPSTSVQQVFKSLHDEKQSIEELGSPLALVEDLMPNKSTGVFWSQSCHCITAETALVHILNFETQLLTAFTNVGFGGEYRIQVGFNLSALYDGMLVEEIFMFLDKDLQVSEDNVCTAFAAVFAPFPGVVYAPRQAYSIPADPPTRGVPCTMQGPVGRTQATAANSGTTSSGKTSRSVQANSTPSGAAVNNKTITNEKHQARRGGGSGGPDDSGSESDDSPDRHPKVPGGNFPKGKGKGDQPRVRLLDLHFSSTLSITTEGLEGKNEHKTTSKVRIVINENHTGNDHPPNLEWSGPWLQVKLSKTSLAAVSNFINQPQAVYILSQAHIQIAACSSRKMTLLSQEPTDLEFRGNSAKQIDSKNKLATIGFTASATPNATLGFSAGVGSSTERTLGEWKVSTSTLMESDILHLKISQNDSLAGAWWKYTHNYELCGHISKVIFQDDLCPSTIFTLSTQTKVEVKVLVFWVNLPQAQPVWKFWKRSEKMPIFSNFVYEVTVILDLEKVPDGSSWGMIKNTIDHDLPKFSALKDPEPIHLHGVTTVAETRDEVKEIVPTEIQISMKSAIQGKAKPMTAKKAGEALIKIQDPPTASEPLISTSGLLTPSLIPSAEVQQAQMGQTVVQDEDTVAIDLDVKSIGLVPSEQDIF